LSALIPIVTNNSSESMKGAKKKKKAPAIQNTEKKTPAKKIPKGGTEVTRKLKEASIIQEELNTYQEYWLMKNLHQKTYKAKKKHKEDPKMSPD
jgi:hypothetical protein